MARRSPLGHAGSQRRSRKMRRRQAMPVLTQQFLLGGMGTCAVAAWLRIQGGKVAKVRRARAAELAWCVALMGSTLAVEVTVQPPARQHQAGWAGGVLPPAG